MFHDIDYTVAQNIGQNAKDIKNRKLQADDKWLDCFKVRTPYDALAYSAIKTKKHLDQETILRWKILVKN